MKNDPGKPYRVQADPDGSFDELVIGAGERCWFHIERMTNWSWWMRIGDQNFDVTLDRKGGVRVYHRNEGRFLDKPER